MSKKERLIEWAKNAVIILLLICTVVLLKEAKYYNNAFELISSAFISTRDSIQAANTEPTEDDPYASASPMAVVVSIGYGNRYASIYDAELVSTDYQRFSATLGEALGSSGEPVKVSRQEWNDILAGEGVYIQFLAPQPLSVISALAGTSMNSRAGQVMSEMLCLSCGEDSVSLYYMDSDGAFYSCETGVSAETFRAKLFEFVPNGAVFAYEKRALSQLEGTLLIPGTMPDIFTVMTGSIPSQSRLKELAAGLFGMNEYTANEYSESDGALVYLDGNSELKIASNGMVEYSGGEQALKISTDSLSGALSLCWRLINSSLELTCGEAELYVSGMDFDETSGNYRICFDYAVNCIPVRLGDEKHAAVFEISAGSLGSAQLCFRSFSIGEDTIDVLPILQAAAIAAANGNESVMLVYAETGNELNCIWVLK